MHTKLFNQMKLQFVLSNNHIHGIVDDVLIERTLVVNVHHDKLISTRQADFVTRKVTFRAHFNNSKPSFRGLNKSKTIYSEPYTINLDIFTFKSKV